MMFYVALYIIVVGFVAIPQKRIAAKVSNISVVSFSPILISMICICMYYGFRNQIGIDDAMYLEVFNQTAEYGTPWRNIEKSYVWVCRFVQYIHGNIQLVFLLYAVVSCLLLYYIIHQLIKETNRTVFIEMFMSFLFLTSMVLMRQFASTCFFVVGYIQLKKGNKTRSIIFLIISVLVHSSSLVGIAVLLLLPLIKKINAKKKSIILVILFFYQYIPIAELVNKAISSTSLDNIYYISYYLGSKTGYRTFSNTLGIVSTLYLIIFLFMLTHKKSEVERNNCSFKSENELIEDLESFTFIYFGLSMFFAQFGYVTRIAYFFSFFAIAFLSGFERHIAANSKKLFAAVCCGAFFVLYLYSVGSFSTENNSIIPYLYNFTLFSS